MFISLGKCKFRIEAANDTLSGRQGESLTMQWNMVDKNVSYAQTILFLGSEGKDEQTLYRGVPGEISNGPQLPSHFGNRSALDISENSYKVTVNDLQFSDEASYLLRVLLSGFPAPQSQKVITIKVLGKHGKFVFKALFNKHLLLF